MAEYESTLAVLRECYVYRIPPRSTSKGYKAADWDVEKHIWAGRLRITARGEQAFIKLEDPNTGELFAQCRYSPDGSSVEPVLDSSRYFVLKIENDKGQHTFIGMGFHERTSAFDFNVALQDHVKHIQMERDAEKRKQEWESRPKKDFSLKEGQTIQINIGSKNPTSKPKTTTTSGDPFFIPPPPSTSKTQQFQPPPQQQQQQQQQFQFQQQFQQQPPQQQQQQSLDWGDFNDFQNSSNTTPNGWTSFS